MTTIRPLHDRVLIRREDDDQTTAGGLIIPDTAKEKPSRGVVIAVGAAHAAMITKSSRWKSRKATPYCSANGPVRK